jgi:hypothetical protein
VANETFLDASGATKYRKSTGAGSAGDPAVAHNIIDGTVTVTGAGGTFPVTGTITANIGTIGTLASEANVNLISSASVTPASTPVGNRVLLIGGLDSGVARVANIDTAGNLQVDIVSSATLTVTGTGGTFPVTDSGGSLTIDAPVGTPAFVRLSDGTNAIATLPVSLASVPSHDVTNAGTFVVQENGAALTALQLIDNLVLAEDAAHVSGDAGIQSLAVRNDSDTSLAGTTGDYTPLQVDANGYLKVNIKAGAGSGGTASTDDAAFTAGSGSGTPMMGFVTSDPVDSGDVGVIGMLANRQVKVTLYDSAGSEVSVGSSPTSSGTSTTDNLLVMLMRIVKLLESNAVVDQQQRQRISVDSFVATVPTVSTVTTCSTVSTVTSVSNVAAQTALAGMDREMYINAAKQTYCQSIRSRLVIS